jgi:hypothetical protein
MPPWLTAILADLSNILGINQAIRSLLTNPNGPNSLPTLGFEIRGIQVYVGDNVVGLPAVLNTLDGMIADATLNKDAILAAIALLPQVGDPVVLPVVPPLGYGGAVPSDIADQVWSFLRGGDLVSPYDYLRSGGIERLSLANSTGYRPDGGIWAYYYAPLLSDGVHATFYPTQDFTTILPTDNLLTWLTRTNTVDFIQWWAGPGSAVLLQGDNGDGHIQWLTVIDDSDFQDIKAAIGLTPTSISAPIWPGLASVTLGTSVALDRAVTLTEAMDGVIVTLATVPPGKPTYVLGGLTATAHIGQVAFVADNGAAEYPQNLSFASEIYVPISLGSASAVVLRTIPGVTGTVQAWTRTV